MLFRIDKLKIIMYTVVAHFRVCTTILQIPSYHFGIDRGRRYVSSTAVIVSINTYSMISCASLCSIRTDCCSSSYSNETTICVLSGMCDPQTEPVDGIIIMKKTHQQGQTEAAPVTEARGDLPDCNTIVNGYLPHPDDCSSFIHCANGIRHIQKCSGVLHWNRLKLNCDYPDNAGCSGK
ncbi:unnamed protein product [Mytilus coruscus]|uniref:Chitin-binding type-2 domain-containing protein n=1 Tax=Mytilus coruscus TaxID=42192 RepID=A0A6J8EL34_MYTCO|nr:unnamed protein product [Mytilus coruscus]